MKAPSTAAQTRNAGQRISEIRPAARRRESSDQVLALHAQVSSRMQTLRRSLESDPQADVRLARLLADVTRVRNVLYLLGRHQRDLRRACPELVPRCTRRAYEWLLLVLARVEDALDARESAPDQWDCWPASLFEYSDLHVGTFLAPLVSQAAEECERDVQFEAPVRERYVLFFRLESAILAVHAGLRRGIDMR
jgi:hypothetical protein